MKNTWVLWAGYQGRYAKAFLTEERIAVPFFGINCNLEKSTSRQGMLELLVQGIWKESGWHSPVAVDALDVLRFKMDIGDWVILPGRFEKLYFIGEVISSYYYEEHDAQDLFHSRKVQWFARNLPITAFPESIQNALQASPLSKPTALESEAREALGLLMKFRQ